MQPLKYNTESHNEAHNTQKDMIRETAKHIKQKNTQSLTTHKRH